MSADDFGEYIPIIGGHREIAQARPRFGYVRIWISDGIDAADNSTAPARFSLW